MCVLPSLLVQHILLCFVFHYKKLISSFGLIDGWIYLWFYINYNCILPLLVYHLCTAVPLHRRQTEGTYVVAAQITIITKLSGFTDILVLFSFLFLVKISIPLPVPWDVCFWQYEYEYTGNEYLLFESKCMVKYFLKQYR